MPTLPTSPVHGGGLMSAISSRCEHTPQAPHSPKTPATTPPKHHQHPHKHTPTLTTETHTTNATPHPHPNTTPHRHFSALHPHTPHHPITRHLCPQTTPHTARSTTHPEKSTAHDPDTRPNAHHLSTCPTHNNHSTSTPHTPTHSTWAFCYSRGRGAGVLKMADFRVPLAKRGEPEGGGSW